MKDKNDASTNKSGRRNTQIESGKTKEMEEETSDISLSFSLKTAYGHHVLAVEKDTIAVHYPLCVCVVIFG